MKFLFRLSTLDPYVNLAIENWLMEVKPMDDVYLLLWRNSPCVVIGRHQDPRLECNLPLMHQLNVPLVRRYSGGGAVYHDLGNSNYSHITDLQDFGKERACVLAREAMGRVGVELRVSERADLWLGAGKVSGSAFRLCKGKAYHHGTMLRQTCLATLQNILNSSNGSDSDVPAGDRYSVGSVKSPVSNTGITHEQFLDAMERQFEPNTVTDINELPKEATAYYDEFRDEDWIYKRQQHSIKASITAYKSKSKYK